MIKMREFFLLLMEILPFFYISEYNGKLIYHYNDFYVKDIEKEFGLIYDNKKKTIDDYLKHIKAEYVHDITEAKFKGDMGVTYKHGNPLSTKLKLSHFLKSISPVKTGAGVFIMLLCAFFVFTFLLGLWFIPEFIFAYRAEKFAFNESNEFSFRRIMANAVQGPFFLWKYHKKFGSKTI